MKKEKQDKMLRLVSDEKFDRQIHELELYYLHNRGQGRKSDCRREYVREERIDLEAVI